MPLYEYECKQCGRRTEKIQKFSDAPLAVCPFCGGPVEQLIHAPAVSFKGGGWYADLYSSSKPGKGSGGQESSSKPAASSSSDSSSSAAPATTPSPAPTASSSVSSDKK